MKKDKPLDPKEVVEARVFLIREQLAEMLEDEADDLRLRASVCKFEGRADEADPYATATANAFIKEAARLRRLRR